MEYCLVPTERHFSWNSALILLWLTRNTPRTCRWKNLSLASRCVLLVLAQHTSLMHTHTHTRTQACTHARTHARPPARPHAHTCANTYANTHACTHAPKPVLSQCYINVGDMRFFVCCFSRVTLHPRPVPARPVFSPSTRT